MPDGEAHLVLKPIVNEEKCLSLAFLLRRTSPGRVIESTSRALEISVLLFRPREASRDRSRSQLPGTAGSACSDSHLSISITLGTYRILFWQRPLGHEGDQSACFNCDKLASPKTNPASATPTLRTNIHRRPSARAGRSWASVATPDRDFIIRHLFHEVNEGA